MNNDEYLKFYQDRVKKLNIRYYRSFRPLRKGKLKQIEKVPAFNEGKIAFSNDLKLSDNPYTGTNSELALIWETGWKEAFEARELFIKEKEIKESKEQKERQKKLEERKELYEETNIYSIEFLIPAFIVFIGILIYSKNIVTALFFAGMAGLFWRLFWYLVAVLLIGIIVIIGIVYFIYKTN